MRFWQRRRLLNACWLAFFACLVGAGLALCGDEQVWVQSVGGVCAVMGAGALLLFALSRPGGW